MIRRTLLLLCALWFSVSVTATPLEFEAFGAIDLHGDPAKAEQVAIILADNSVPADARAAIAEKVAGSGALAAVVDTERYLAAMNEHPEDCAYHAWEFEKLSKYVQKTAGLDRYHPPVLAGIGAGAALAYTTITESLDGTFAGMTAAGLCRPVPMRKDLCANRDETWTRLDASRAELIPTAEVETPWVALPTRGACVAEETADFFRDTAGATVRPTSTAAWASDAWRSEVAGAVVETLRAVPTRTLDSGVADLPLHEVESETKGGKVFALILTGDGGWAGIDRDVAEHLAAGGLNVVGFSSLEFLWHKRTPDEIAQAVSRIIDHYTEKWHADGVVLVGYSRGADILPFAFNRLPDEEKSKVRAAALLGPGLRTRFEIKVSDWLGEDEDATGVSVVDEIAVMPKVPALCVYGEEEGDAGTTACPLLAADRARIVKTAGGHHFDGAYDTVAKAIADLLAK